jgi:hypothetical protein
MPGFKQKCQPDGRISGDGRAGQTETKAERPRLFLTAAGGLLPVERRKACQRCFWHPRISPLKLADMAGERSGPTIQGRPVIYVLEPSPAAVEGRRYKLAFLTLTSPRHGQPRGGEG